MRQLIYAALLLISMPAAAEPVTYPSTCTVTIARAPDEVREVVEAWVRSESHCSVALEIRIVTTEGGLYLLAQDEHGRMRERIVPDAQTAGVLVASWIADDNAPSPPPAAPVVTAPPLSSTILPDLDASESLTPPGLAPVAIETRATPPVRRSKWISLGALLPLTPEAGAGLRVDADVFRRGKWALGAAGSVGFSTQPLWSSWGGDGAMESVDGKLMAVCSRTSQIGRWQLRPSLGVGVMHSEGRAYTGDMLLTYAGTFATAEASFMLSRELGKKWAVYVAPTATISMQEFDLGTDPGPTMLHRGVADLALFSGLRHRL
jgi:hypothetical protein